MKLIGNYFIAFTVIFVLANTFCNASSTIPISPEQRVDLAGAICIGTVLSNRPFRSPQADAIYTESLIRVDESLKGIFPKIVRLVHRGGTIDNESEMDGYSPMLIKGDQYVLYLRQRNNGTLYAMEGGPSAIRISNNVKSIRIEATLQNIRRRNAQMQNWGIDVTEQGVNLTEASISTSVSEVDAAALVATGLITDSVGVPSRFIITDRGQPIPYIVDAESLPSGITLEQATNAVANAFQAWTDVTSLKFKFEGFQIFGQAANDVPGNLGKILVQLHDMHGAVASTTTLGIGGRTSFSDSDFPMGGLGGRVGPNEFQISGRGFVVLKHMSPTLSTLSTFEEVLCHEIGHALSMAHSSEDSEETDEILSDAIMYFRVHADDRGATLGDYDPPIIQQAYPISNTPPFGFDRIIYAVASMTPLSNPEVNQVEITGYDLQDDPLTRVLLNETNMFGTFDLNGDIITYNPTAFGDSGPLDPQGSSVFDQVQIRIDDGINLSPPIRLRVLQFSTDTKPSGLPDGIPDNWMIDNFGNDTPINGISGADDDPDGDELTNICEYQCGSNPLDSSSTFKIESFTAEEIQWTARPFELYEILISTDLSSWELTTPPISPATNIGLVSGVTNIQSPSQFLRIRKVP